MYEQGSTKLMTRSRLQLGLVLGLIALGTFSLSGCGVRGSLEAPEGVTKTGDAAPGSTPDPQKPHKSSILDPLIR
jgi:predicted small lipoprotein YifL